MLTNTTSTVSNEIKELSFARTILILGVVLIHSNPIAYVHPQYSDLVGNKIVCIIVPGICGSCVPVFFSISGLLFFRSFNRWNWQTWKSKLSRRVMTLLIPYILWNLIASLLFLIKTRYLGFNDFSVFADDNFHFLKYVSGFWNLHDGYPFDMPLWFVRNLMIFCTMAPLVYLLARKTSVFLIAFVLFLYSYELSHISIFYFIAGAWLGIHPNYYTKVTEPYMAALAIIVWITLAIFIGTYDFVEWFSAFLYKIRNFAALISIIGLCKCIKSNKIPFILHKLQPATFFIFALHGLFCTVTTKACLSLTGGRSSIAIIAAFFLSFVLLVSISYVIYQLCKLFCPRLGRLLCGGRF